MQPETIVRDDADQFSVRPQASRTEPKVRAPALRRSLRQSELVSRQISRKSATG